MRLLGNSETALRLGVLVGELDYLMGRVLLGPPSAGTARWADFYCAAIAQSFFFWRIH